MNTFDLTRDIDAPAKTVWAILDDFGAIADWSAGVRRSTLTSAGPVGEGSTRHCDFVPMGGVNERIIHHEPGRRMTVHLYEMFKMPVTEAVADFVLEPIGDRTRLTLTVDYEPNRMGRMAKGVTDKQMRKGMGAMADDLATESARRATGSTGQEATDAAA